MSVFGVSAGCLTECSLTAHPPLMLLEHNKDSSGVTRTNMPADAIEPPDRRAAATPVADGEVDVMQSESPRRASFREDTSGATLAALLLAVLVPAGLAAMALGWRPLDTPPAQAALGWWNGLRGDEAAPAPAILATPMSWALSDGYFYGETASATAGAGPRGYAVTDADAVPFWSEFQRLGGVTYLGYPLSQRFTEDGVTRQLFQRGMLRFANADAGVTVVPLLDQLHAAGHDAALRERWGVPPLELPVGEDSSPDQADQRIDWVFRDYPALAAYWAGAPDAFALLGLPTSTVVDVGAYYAVRFQSGVLQQWKRDEPWAKTGEVTAANVGEAVRALGLVPAEALAPAAVTPPASDAVPPAAPPPG
jgi:hypothetical protein